MNKDSFDLSFIAIDIIIVFDLLETSQIPPGIKSGHVQPLKTAKEQINHNWLRKHCLIRVVSHNFNDKTSRLTNQIAYKTFSVQIFMQSW